MIMFMSGLFALLAALGHQAPAAIAGALAVGAGACEWHGSQQLRNGQGPGIEWMKLGELGLLAIVLIYSIWMMIHFDDAEFAARMPDWYLEKFETDLRAAGMNDEDMPAFFRLVNALSYAIIAGVSCIYQGGLAFYYHSKRHAVHAAMAQMQRS